MQKNFRLNFLSILKFVCVELHSDFMWISYSFLENFSDCVFYGFIWNVTESFHWNFIRLADQNIADTWLAAIKNGTVGIFLIYLI